MCFNPIFSYCAKIELYKEMKSVISDQRGD